MAPVYLYDMSDSRTVWCGAAGSSRSWSEGGREPDGASEAGSQQPGFRVAVS